MNSILPLSVIFLVGLTLAGYGLYSHWRMEKNGKNMKEGTGTRAKFVALSYLTGFGIVLTALSGIFLYEIFFK